MVDYLTKLFITVIFNKIFIIFKKEYGNWAVKMEIIWVEVKK